MLHSNKDPVQIASLFLKSVEQRNFIPKRLRTDCGSENGTIAAIQAYFRRNHNDELSGLKSHIFGTSHNNQRIEAWWSQFRKSQTNFVIGFFQNLVDEIYNPENPIHKACAWFCFEPLIRKLLEEFKEQWNSHYIRKSQYAAVNGRPNSLYMFPKFGKSDQKFSVDNGDLDEIKEYLNDLLDYDNDNELLPYYEYFDFTMVEMNLERNSTWQGARHLFVALIDQAI